MEKFKNSSMKIYNNIHILIKKEKEIIVFFPTSAKKRLKEMKLNYISTLKKALSIILYRTN